MAETISSYSPPVSLTADSNPLTVASNGTVSAMSGPAVYGDQTGPGAGAGWSVTNAGLIEATGTYGGAIDLQSTGTIDNGGTISGFYDVVVANAAGSIANDGTLTASGIAVSLAAGTITNAGDAVGKYGIDVFDVASKVPGNADPVTTTGSIAGTGDTLVVKDRACFCRGTRILTPRGERPVEQLAPGDEVTTLSGEARTLTWIGRGRSLVTPANPDAGPIVVRQGAIEDGVPARDLYLTKGHSLLLDGVLIPVEYLVNDRSIAWDKTARVVEFYHLELEHHDVLLAESAAAESYREDGNRHLFHNTDMPRHAGADMAHYAPVLTGGPEVDRAWQRLLARAGTGEVATTEDPDLHLLADGVRVDGEAEADGMRYRFRLEQAPFALRVRSRVCNPVRLGTGRDPRDLGVALRRLVVRGSGVELVLPYDSPWFGEGCNGPEPAERIRWTTGDAAIPARAMAVFDGPVEIELELGMLTRYPRPAEAAPTAGVPDRAERPRSDATA